MRSFVRAALTALAFTTVAAAGASAQGAGPKIAYIRSQDIIAATPGHAEAEAQMQKEIAGYQAELKRMGDSLQALIGDYNKAELTLSPAAKQTRQEQIRKKEDDFQQRQQELQQKAQQREAELVQPIMQQIQSVLQKIRDEEGYAMIFDAQSSAGVVVAADKNLDITDKVIARVKASSPAAKVPTPTGPVGSPAGIGSKKPPAR